MGVKKTRQVFTELFRAATGDESDSFLVHERHGALRLIADDAGEELQRQSHVHGHEDVGGVDDHGDGGEEHEVEERLLPRLQHVDAGDEHVLVVEPGQVLPQVLYAHLARRTDRRTPGADGFRL